MDSYHKFANGITMRKDATAAYGFFPKQGVAFAADARDYSRLVTYLSNFGSRPPKGYPPFKGNEFHFPNGEMRILGKASLDCVPKAEYPLIINWMITGKCNCRCTYCYAQDLMHDQNREPKELKEIEKIVRELHKLRPIAVAVSGGEPTLSEFLFEAIASLSRFTSVIVDTNGIEINKSHIEFFKKYKVHVRVSLDSFNMTHHYRMRKCENKENEELYNKLLGVLDEMYRAGIGVTMHTVATKCNYDDILKFDKFIENIKVTKHRIRLAEKPNHVTCFDAILGSVSARNRFISRILKMPNLSSSLRYLSPKNSLILIDPSGKYYTESTIEGQGKILIDTESPDQPSLECLANRVDMHAHSSRYLK